MSAHFSCVFPVCQAMVSECIMPGVTGGCWGFFYCFSLAQCIVWVGDWGGPPARILTSYVGE
jgi:hypothetical protein